MWCQVFYELTGVFSNLNELHRSCVFWYADPCFNFNGDHLRDNIHSLIEKVIISGPKHDSLNFIKVFKTKQQKNPEFPLRNDRNLFITQLIAIKLVFMNTMHNFIEKPHQISAFIALNHHNRNHFSMLGLWHLLTANFRDYFSFFVGFH